MEQATENQVNYIRILTAEAKEAITAEWAMNGFRAPQNTGLKIKYGVERFWDMDRADLAAEWQTTVDGTLVYLDEIDQQAPAMTKAAASEMIDILKKKNVVHLYWQNAGR